MTYCGYLLDETIAICKVTLPTLLFNCLETALYVEDFLLIVTVGKESLSIAALGFAFYNMLWSCAEGLLTAEDNLLTHAHAMRDSGALRYWSIVTVFVMTLFVAASIVLMLFSPLIIKSVFGINRTLAYEAAEFVMCLIPAFVCHAAFRVIQKYFQSQHLFAPLFFALTIGNIVNVIGNVIFLYVFNMGAYGSALATSIARLSSLIIVVLYFKVQDSFSNLRAEFLHKLEKDVGITYFSSNQDCEEDDEAEHSTIELNIRHRHHKTSTSEEEGDGEDVEDRDNEEYRDTDFLVPKSSEKADPYQHRQNYLLELISKICHFKGQFLKDCVKFVLLGTPGVIMCLINMWSLEILSITTAKIGMITLGSQQIMIAISIFIYMALHLPLSSAVSVRVQELLNAQNFKAAQFTSHLVQVINLLITGFLAYLLYQLRNYFFPFLLSNEELLYRINQIVWVVAIFQVINGFQLIQQGVLRGLLRNNDVLVFTLVSIWLVGIPLAVYFCLYSRPSYGLQGLWYGYLVGLGLLVLLQAYSLYTVDWEEEVRRAQWRKEAYGKRFALYMASPVLGSNSFGGFTLLPPSEEELLDELENVEYYPDDPEEGGEDEENADDFVS